MEQFHHYATCICRCAALPLCVRFFVFYFLFASSPCFFFERVAGVNVPKFQIANAMTRTHENIAVKCLIVLPENKTCEFPIEKQRTNEPTHSLATSFDELDWLSDNNRPNFCFCFCNTYCELFGNFSWLDSRLLPLNARTYYPNVYKYVIKFRFIFSSHFQVIFG